MTVAQQTTEKQTPRRQLAPARERVVPRPSASVEEDELIRLAVETLLQSSNYYPVREVRCFVEDGVVMMFGTVPSFYMKQTAQTLVMKLEVVIRVENHCEVVSPSHRNGSIHQST